MLGGLRTSANLPGQPTISSVLFVFKKHTPLVVVSRRTALRPLVIYSLKMHLAIQPAAESRHWRITGRGMEFDAISIKIILTPLLYVRLQPAAARELVFTFIFNYLNNFNHTNNKENT